MKRITLTLMVASALFGCKKAPEVPATYTDVPEQANIMPDYRDVTVPPNIAPLNFILTDAEGCRAVVRVVAEGKECAVVGAKDGIVEFDTLVWRKLMTDHRGASIEIEPYVERDGKWLRYKAHHIYIATEEIDPYLSYRLIEPGYELYRQLGLYQRNLTNWQVATIYENNRTYDEDENHCINCHTYRNNSTQDMLFHVRSSHAGTIVAHDGEPRKVSIKGDSILTSGVYSAWHPTQMLVAMSTNKTGQVFHLINPNKIEVMDDYSDLILYDPQANTVETILADPLLLETFPTWSPDGQWLYYCEAIDPQDDAIPDSAQSMKMMKHYEELQYNIRRMPFDPEARTFGPSELVVDCRSTDRSASFPRLSPDGRYLLWAQARYGQFHIWHRDADLWVKDLQTDSIYALDEANSPDVDSYHTWSSNGRWIVFSSRRIDGNYTRPHIAYFDSQGQAHKAFCLPQRDPRHNTLLLKSYNVPELTRDAVLTTHQRLSDCIHNTDPAPIKFLPK